MAASEEQIAQCRQYLKELPKIVLSISNVDDNGNYLSEDILMNKVRSNFERALAIRCMAWLRIINFVGVKLTAVACHRLIGQGALKAMRPYITEDERIWLRGLLKLNGYKAPVWF